MFRASRPRAAVMALLALLVALSLWPSSALAQSSSALILSTSYPGVYTHPGETVTFPLNLSTTSATPFAAELSLSGLPEGWTADLTGGGYRVHQVFVSRESSASVSLQVDVPATAKAGRYGFTVNAAGGGARDSLQIELQVDARGKETAELVAQYPALQGPAGAEFDFQVTLKNQAAAKQTFSLAANPPEGWQVEIHPSYSDKQVATLAVDAGSSERLDVKVKVPDQAAAGEYKVPLVAAGDNVKAETELIVAVTGSYSLTMEPLSGRYNARATGGHESAIDLVVKNTGSAPLTGLTFSHYGPSNWQVSFKPDQLDTLAPGETRQVQAIIKPDRKAIAGDYMVTLSARAGQFATDENDIRVAVEVPTVWGWVGVGLIAAVVAGVGGVFRVYGRR